jgi:hypothetical protein
MKKPFIQIPLHASLTTFPLLIGGSWLPQFLLTGDELQLIINDSNETRISFFIFYEQNANESFQQHQAKKDYL